MRWRFFARRLAMLVARPGCSEPPGAWRSSDSHISESAVNSGKPYERTGSSDITSRLVAQTIKGTGLTPAGVVATRPLTGDTLPADEPALLADRPQADATSADATAPTMTGHHFPLLPMPPTDATPARLTDGVHYS